MRNPDKHIRKAFVDCLTGVGVVVFDKQIPKADAIPEKYVLVTSQTKIRTQACREAQDWDCTIVLDLFALQDLSYVSSVELDDYEEIILNAVKPSNLPIANFDLHRLSLDGSPVDLSFVTDTQSILRKVLTYRLVVEESAIVTI